MQNWRENYSIDCHQIVHTYHLGQYSIVDAREVVFKYFVNHLVRTKVSKNIGFNFLLKNALTVLIKVVSKYPLRVIYTYGTWDAVGKERGWKGNYKFFRTLFSLKRMTDFNVFCTKSSNFFNTF